MSSRLRTVVLLRSAFLVTLAYFLLTAPDKLYTNFFVAGVGYIVSPDVGAGSEGWIGVLLLSNAVDDFMRLSGPHVAESFMNVLPVRLIVLFTFCIASYLKVGPLARGPTFMYLFYDSIFTGWCFLAAREEINEDNKNIIRDTRGYVEEESAPGAGASIYN